MARDRQTLSFSRFANGAPDGGSLSDWWGREAGAELRLKKASARGRRLWSKTCSAMMI